jgi:hypothetical protein
MRQQEECPRTVVCISICGLRIEVRELEEGKHVPAAFICLRGFYILNRMGILQKPAESQGDSPGSRKEGGGPVAKGVVRQSHVRLNDCASHQQAVE